MKTIGKALMQIFVIVLVFGLGVIGAYIYFDKFGKQEDESVVDNRDSGVDFELPGEVERKVVTVSEVESKLEDIGELSTYAGTYSVSLGEDETRYIFDKVKLFGTTNSIEVTCEGVVKVGYDISDISVKVVEDKINIVIPEAKLNDNYIIWDTVECEESNNILNPIEFSQYQSLIGDLEEKGLEDVKENGIYDSAEKNLKTVIKAFLSDFDGYEIEFTSD